MPFPYELYPKAKETHCLNLPEISVSRPPFPGSIRTVDGCLWGWRDNNSYADTTITANDGTSYKYGTVFTEKTTKGEGIACSSYANCYIGCSCNTSNGWYSTCQGSDCKSATDNHYTGVNSLSAGKSISDVASISASGANSGISAMAAAKSGLKTASAAGNYTATAASAGLKTASVAVGTAGATSGISAMASSGLTCYKKKTCTEGGYYNSVPAGKKCPEVAYNGYTCYDTNCTNACPDGWFSADSRPVVTHMLFLESLNNPGCYQASCAPGYSTTVNGAVVAEYQGVKCYKDLAPDTIYFSFSNSHCHKAIGGGGNYHCLRMSASLRKDSKPLAYQIDDVKLPANVTLLIGNDYCVGRSCLPISYVSQQIHLSNGSDGTINGFRGSCMRVGGSNTGAGGALSDQITYQITNVSNSGLGANEDTMEIILKGKTYTVSIDFDSTKKSCSPNSAGSWVHDESFCVLGNCTILPGY